MGKGKAVTGEKGRVGEGQTELRKQKESKGGFPRSLFLFCGANSTWGRVKVFAFDKPR
jgi:hypothetical protein